MTTLKEVFNRDNFNIQERSRITKDYLSEKGYTVSDMNDFIIISFAITIDKKKT
jgi:hypothetical protein